MDDLLYSRWAGVVVFGAISLAFSIALDRWTARRLSRHQGRPPRDRSETEGR